MVRSSHELPPDERELSARRDSLTSRLRELREALEHQRDFRRAQLAEFDSAFLADLRVAVGTPPSTSAPVSTDERQRVAQMVATAAFHALTDIERALTRMRTGNYGRCCGCARNISLALLMAIPQTTLCLACRRVIEGHRCTTVEPRGGTG
jgi:DnaK suppressor protein